MISHQASSMSNYLDMIDTPTSKLNLGLKNRSSLCKSTIVPVQHKSMKISDANLCLLCNKSFAQKATYQNHLCVHTKQETAIYTCNICNKSFSVPARLTRHYRTHTGEKPYQCDYCTKSFSVKENLSVHRRIHTKERPYRCDVCHSGFEHSGKLHRHMRIHTGERPHKCSICDKTFIQSGQLVIHMRTHTGEKPYLCVSCGKGFTCSKQLKVHTRTHTGEKPYKCDICGKSFGYNHVLKLHQVAHYGEKFYKCILCQKTFSSKKSMEIHVKSPSNCNLYDIAKFNTATSNTIDFKNEIMPYNISHTELAIEGTNELQQLDEKCISYKVSNSYKKTEQLIYHESYQNSTTNFIRPSNQNLTTESIVPSLEKESQSFTLLCRHSPIDLNKYIPYTHKIKEYTFLTPVISSNMQSSYSRLEENSLFGAETKENVTLHKNLAMCYKNVSQVYTISSPMHATDIVIPNSRNDLTLPPRKRCKIIWESSLLEKSELDTPRRCNSVIKFAKMVKTNMIKS